MEPVMFHISNDGKTVQLGKRVLEGGPFNSQKAAEACIQELERDEANGKFTVVEL